MGPASDSNTPSVLPSWQGTGEKPVLPWKTPPCSQILKYNNKFAHFHHSAEVCKNHDVQKMGTSFLPVFWAPIVWLAPPQESRNHPGISMWITLKWAPCYLKKDLWRVVKHWHRFPDWWWMSHPWKHQRSHWTGLWPTWCSWNCHCSVQEGWTGWHLRYLPT